MSDTKLDFLRPLYDIAVWQFLVMGKQDRTKKKPVMTYRMHEVVANLLVKLLDAKAFTHLTKRLEEEKYIQRTGGWKKGELATSKVTEWCQDQWRRKNPVLPESLKVDKCGLCLPLFGDQMPVCHKCGTPCPECRTELGLELPDEIQSGHEFLAMAATIDDSDGEEESAATASLQPGLQERMSLRTRR